MNIAKISCYFWHNVVTLKLRKEYISIVIYDTPVLGKRLNSLMYRTLFYANIYGSYKLLKKSGFWPTLYIQYFMDRASVFGRRAFPVLRSTCS